MIRSISTSSQKSRSIGKPLGKKKASDDEVEGLKQKDPVRYVKKNANKRLAAINKLAFDIIPQDPTRPEYRQGNTLGDGPVRAVQRNMHAIAGHMLENVVQSVSKFAHLLRFVKRRTRCSPVMPHRVRRSTKQKLLSMRITGDLVNV